MMNTQISKLNEKSAQNGQAGIVILLLMVVLVTIALSIAGRTVTDIRLSRQEEETTRSFDVAEAGIEEALRTGAAGTITIDEVTATYEIETMTSVETELDEGETLEVSLIDYAAHPIYIYWGSPSDQCTNEPKFASLVLAGIAVPGAIGNVYRIGVAGLSCNRGDNFIVANVSAASSEGYKWRFRYSPAANYDYLRIRAVYAGTRIKVIGAQDAHPLPAQYALIHSEAAGSGGENRAVQVSRTLPFAPSIFDYAIFSRGSLNK